MTPQFIGRILESRVFFIVSRIVLVSMFLGAGLDKLLHFQGTVAEMALHGLMPPGAFAVAAVATLLIASALIILNVAAWLGFGALGIFVALTIPIAHPFWSFQGDEGLLHFHVAAEHISLIGGLMAGAILCHLQAQGIGSAVARPGL
ncbi:DoxX family protein [Aquabacter sp. L1I39]|uniref:DoxX family protein n=1 Tax=Aquabacter sp. L1I39 TaxID=2820278 RepID=UPI001ADC99EF|nr:DoxX family protein [Aquabacter sp. L1I39]QTL01878.1 DoxX family protein [Aquabacter sp. L1I39]